MASIPLKFAGGVGSSNKGELGGVQAIINGNSLFEYGQRPDYTAEFYGFPYRAPSHMQLDINEYLQMYLSMPGINRPDYELHRGNTPQEADGELVVSHWHYDHVGGITSLNPYLRTITHLISKQIGWTWQVTSGRTVNQFVDFYGQYFLMPDTRGGVKFGQGDEALISRNIQTVEDGERFEAAGADVSGHLIDHSLMGAMGMLYRFSEKLKLGVSGDIRWRGRRGKDTTNYLETLIKEDVTHMLIEGSLLHFNHDGTENDVADIMTELLQGKAFAGVAYPPRDFDRLISMYSAAKRNHRMLVVSPAQALTLMVLDGVNGCPRMNWKYVGVLMPRKRKGLIDRQEFPGRLVDSDYYYWERPFLEWSRWDGHQGKPQRVAIDDIKKNQEQFLVYMPYSGMVNLLTEIRPKRNSLYVRSHPAPWTTEMEVMEDRTANILREFGMDDGPKPDYLNREYMRRLHQVHITGHFNRRELKNFISLLPPKCVIIPYHCMNPEDFTEISEGRKIEVPLLNEEMMLHESA